MEKLLQGNVIINADDFGLSPGVNEAIMRLHQQGRLTSVSIFTNMPWSQEALLYAQSAADLHLGVHLNLTTGSPILPVAQVPSLVAPNGLFFDLPVLISRYYAGRLSRVEIEAELRAQIELCLQYGLKLHHVDSHMHFHAIPSLGDMISRMAGRYHVETVRNPKLSAFVVPPFGRARLVDDTLRKTRHSVLQSTQNIVARRGIVLNEPSHRADQLIYLRWCLDGVGDPPARFRACIDLLQSNTLEIIAHPALIDEVLPQHSNYVDGRELELAFLSGDQFVELMEDL